MWDVIFTKEINAFGESGLSVTYQTTPCGDTLIYSGVKKGNQMKIKEKNQRKTKSFKTNKHFITPCTRISLSLLVSHQIFYAFGFPVMDAFRRSLRRSY